MIKIRKLDPECDFNDKNTNYSYENCSKKFMELLTEYQTRNNRRIIKDYSK